MKTEKNQRFFVSPKTKKFSKKTHLIIGIVVLSYLIAIALYPSMPELIASHWNINGEVDGYMTKFWGLFLLPFVLTGCVVLFYFIPKIDPLKKNIKKFQNHYESFILVLTLYLFYINALTVTWNLGYRFDLNVFMIASISFLFIYIGFFLKTAKRNWFIGIRTPWTLSNDKVWEKTHQLGSKLFIASGIISLFGLFKSKCLIWFLLVPVLLSTLVLFVYSYLEWKKLKK